MKIKETTDVSFLGAIEIPPPEDVVVLLDSAGIAPGAWRAFSVRVGSGLPTSTVGTEIAYTPSPNGDGGVFHIVNAATTAPTS